MLKNIKKTNAMRILDAKKIHYIVSAYEITDNLLDGISVANKLNLKYDMIFKTLVTKSDSGIFVCLIPVNKTLDLKELAKKANVKKLDMLPSKDVTKVTGYVIGGCSPIGMKKTFPTFMDKSSKKKKVITISAGEVGKQITINTNDLISLLNIGLGGFTIEEDENE